MTDTERGPRVPIETRPLVSDGEASDWAVARDRLETPEAYRTYWLTTLGADGEPHAMPLIGLWLEGRFYFLSSPGSRKARDLADDPRCVLTVGITSLPALDVSAEGTAAKVTDDATVRRIVDLYGSEHHWPLTIEEDGVHGQNAPTAGPPPYAVYELTPSTVYGLPGVHGTNEKGEGREGSIAPTRWRFDGT